MLGTALENIVNKGDYPILISHAETPGQAFNVNKLNADAAARKNTVGTASKGINWLAAQGKKPFPAKRTPLLLIGSYTYTATWLVTADDAIKSISDLRGKRIAMGRIPQAIWGYEPDAPAALRLFRRFLQEPVHPVCGHGRSRHGPGQRPGGRRHHRRLHGPCQRQVLSRAPDRGSDRLRA